MTRRYTPAVVAILFVAAAGYWHERRTVDQVAPFVVQDATPMPREIVSLSADHVLTITRENDPATVVCFERPMAQVVLLPDGPTGRGRDRVCRPVAQWLMVP